MEGAHPDTLRAESDKLSTRSRISPAALFVKVIARIFHGFTPFLRSATQSGVSGHVSFRILLRRGPKAGLLCRTRPPAVCHLMYHKYSYFCSPFTFPDTASSARISHILKPPVFRQQILPFYHRNTRSCNLYYMKSMWLFLYADRNFLN